MIELTRDVVCDVSYIKVCVSAGRRAKRRCGDLIADLSSSSKFHVDGDIELDGRMSRRGLPDCILDSPGVVMDKGLDIGGLIGVDGQVHLHQGLMETLLAWPGQFPETRFAYTVMLWLKMIVSKPTLAAAALFLWSADLA